MKKSLFIATLCLPAIIGCSDDNSGEEPIDVKLLPEIENVSLNNHSSSQEIMLMRNVESEGATVSLKYDSPWIRDLKLKGEVVSFNVLENTDIETGHRFDTIVISVQEKRIGTICVSQARKPISTERLQWATVDALYRNKALCNSDMSGKEVTMAIYNLSKTTNGQDSYKNYPAFAYCIEMNHDPEHNMEWHLPSMDEMKNYIQGQSYEGTPIFSHNYWWTASENDIRGDAFNLYSKSVASRGSVDKGGSWWVMAFRNGQMEE